MISIWHFPFRAFLPELIRALCDERNGWFPRIIRDQRNGQDGFPESSKIKEMARMVSQNHPRSKKWPGWFPRIIRDQRNGQDGFPESSEIKEMARMVSQNHPRSKKWPGWFP